MKREMKRLILPLALIVLLGGVLLWLLVPRLQALLDGEQTNLLWQLEGAAACDLHHGPCRAKLGEGQWVELAISPHPIRMLQQLTLQVSVVGLPAEQVQIDFNGVEMNMGYNRPRLEKQADGVFVGDGILPLCVLESMTWRARVLLDSPPGRGVADFYFVTSRRQQ